MAKIALWDQTASLQTRKLLTRRKIGPGWFHAANSQKPRNKTKQWKLQKLRHGGKKVEKAKMRDLHHGKGRREREGIDNDPLSRSLRGRPAYSRKRRPKRPEAALQPCACAEDCSPPSERKQQRKQAETCTGRQRKKK
jgi:hypothetical protein